jgi:hypothetical protein
MYHHPNIPQMQEIIIGAGEMVPVPEKPPFRASYGISLDRKKIANLERDGRILFFGGVHYRDVWKRDHVTRFCWRHAGTFWIREGKETDNENT